MKLHVLAGALALSLGATALAPVAAQADDRHSRSYRDDRSRSYSSRSYSRSYSSRSYRDARYSRGYASYSRSYRPYRSYNYRPYRSYRSYPSYYYDDYAYGGYYAPYSYRAPVVVAPAYGYGYGYRGYRPLSLGVRVGGPHFGVWLGF